MLIILIKSSLIYKALGLRLRRRVKPKFSCSLPNSYESFVDIMLYGIDTLSIGDIKDVLQSKELKRMVSSSIESSSNSGLIFTKGGSKERNGSNKMKPYAKLKSRGPRCYHCKELRHIRCDCPQ